jgi:hypothetical protein
VVYIFTTGFSFYDFLFLEKHKKEEKEMKIFFVGAMAATFVLGFGFIPILFFLGRIVLAQAKVKPLERTGF